MLQSELWCPVAPVRGPFLFMDNSWLLSLELWPVLARNLHRVVLRQFVFVVGPLEEATLSAQERGKVDRSAEGRGRNEGKNLLMSYAIANHLDLVFLISKDKMVYFPITCLVRDFHFILKRSPFILLKQCLSVHLRQMRRKTILSHVLVQSRWHLKAHSPKKHIHMLHIVSVLSVTHQHAAKVPEKKSTHTYIILYYYLEWQVDSGTWKSQLVK